MRGQDPFFRHYNKIKRRRRREREKKGLPMRKVKLTKKEFDHMFFPYVTNVAAEGEVEFETSIRLIKAIRDENKTEAKVLTDQEQRTVDSGAVVYPSHVLRRDKDTFLLEEDEHKLAVKRLKVNMTRIAPLMGEDYQAMFEAVKDAEEVKKAEKKKPAKKKAAPKKKAAKKKAGK